MLPWGLNTIQRKNRCQRAGKACFVGNLGFNTSEEDVRQLFAAYGRVDRVTIVRDRDTDQPRGFGFVEMASAEDGQGHRCLEWHATRRPRTKCK